MAEPLQQKGILKLRLSPLAMPMEFPEAFHSVRTAQLSTARRRPL